MLIARHLLLSTEYSNYKLYLQVATAAEKERIYNYLVILKIHIFICLYVFVSAFAPAQQQQ